MKYYKDTARAKDDYAIYRVDLKRENDKFQKGYEVFRDIYTLSECEGFVAGISMVSIAARIVKTSTGNDFKNCVILDKGLYRQDQITTYDEARKHNLTNLKKEAEILKSIKEKEEWRENE